MTRRNGQNRSLAALRRRESVAIAHRLLTSPLNGRSNAVPKWKVLLAVVSMVLAGSVWFLGVMDSLGRPSVAPALSLEQQELALLADPALTPSLKPLLVGQDPAKSLLETLRETPLDSLNDRQALLFASLETDPGRRNTLLELPFQAPELQLLQQALATASSSHAFSSEDHDLLAEISPDPLIRRLVCEALGGAQADCVESSAAKAAARRLVLSEFLPVVALLLGSLLLVRQLWLLLRRKQSPWPELQAAPLGVVDMVLLIAGGFVVLGEVVVPLVVAPLSALVSQSIAAPLNQSVSVLIGYCALATPPLLILKSQLDGLDQRLVPEGGWLQWRVRPWWSALFQGGRAWLMVMPPVVLTGWLMSRVIGDQGGSNPLLEMVLNGKDPLALLLLAITAVVLAPLFEETVFRGVLLPALGRSFGRGWSVFGSALVFAVAHLSIGELLPLLVLGLGLALLRLSSGRLLPCVVMHALWNGVTFLNLILLGT